MLRQQQRSYSRQTTGRCDVDNSVLTVKTGHCYADKSIKIDTGLKKNVQLCERKHGEPRGEMCLKGCKWFLLSVLIILV